MLFGRTTKRKESMLRCALRLHVQSWAARVRRGRDIVTCQHPGGSGSTSDTHAALVSTENVNTHTESVYEGIEILVVWPYNVGYADSAGRLATCTPRWHLGLLPKAFGADQKGTHTHQPIPDRVTSGLTSEFPASPEKGRCHFALGGAL